MQWLLPLSQIHQSADPAQADRFEVCERSGFKVNSIPRCYVLLILYAPGNGVRTALGLFDGDGFDRNPGGRESSRIHAEILFGDCFPTNID